MKVKRFLKLLKYDEEKKKKKKARVKYPSSPFSLPFNCREERERERERERE